MIRGKGRVFPHTNGKMEEFQFSRSGWSILDSGLLCSELEDCSNQDLQSWPPCSGPQLGATPPQADYETAHFLPVDGPASITPIERGMQAGQGANPLASKLANEDMGYLDHLLYPLQFQGLESFFSDLGTIPNDTESLSLDSTPPANFPVPDTFQPPLPLLPNAIAASTITTPSNCISPTSLYAESSTSSDLNSQLGSSIDRFFPPIPCPQLVPSVPPPPPPPQPSLSSLYNPQTLSRNLPSPTRPPLRQLLPRTQPPSRIETSEAPGGGRGLTCWTGKAVPKRLNRELERGKAGRKPTVGGRVGKRPCDLR